MSGINSNKKILQILGAYAGEVLYFDDAIENIESAKKLGINAVHYQDVSDYEASIYHYLPGR